jgi:hypothetical protein
LFAVIIGPASIQIMAAQNHTTPTAAGNR